MELPFSEPRTRRIVLDFGLVYLALLLGAVAVTGWQYREYYATPRLDRTMDENAVLQEWNRSYAERYRDYRSFLRPITLGLALYLSAWAAALGVWKKSVWKGLLALAGGAMVTVVALSALPTIYFPFDQYSVAAVWVMSGLPWIAATWALLTLAGRMLSRHKTT
jgi:hypothetical protein